MADLFNYGELKEEQFQKICRIVKENSGINLKTGKEALVKARLLKRIRELGFRSYDEYIRFIGSPEGCHEITHMIDAITTNKTSFFREYPHFQFLSDVILKEIQNKRLRIWSAACSSGEEPYSIAITLFEAIPNILTWDIKILATDISLEMLRKAKIGVYHHEALRDLPKQLIAKYFDPECGGNYFRIRREVKELIYFAYLNLMGDWPMKGPFDVIFCRNVMIYFDKPTQQALVNRFWGLIRPGGYLLVGHSEGLVSISHGFKYIRPATYKKPG